MSAVAPPLQGRAGLRVRLGRVLERALFPRSAATNLAVMRVLIGCFAVDFLWQWRVHTVRVCTDIGHEHFAPLGVLAFMPQPMPDALFRALYDLCMGTSALFVLGLAMRVIGPLFAALLLVVLTYRQSWGFIYHTENLLVVHVAVLGLARSADVLSLDAWLRPRVGRARALLARAPALPSWRYGWPAQLMVLITGITYWVAGMAKLGTSGFSWVSDAHLLAHLGNNALRYHLFADGAAAFTYLAYGWPLWVWSLLGMTSITLELGAPLAVLSPRLALLIALGLCGFHWGVQLFMGIPFAYQLYGFAFAPFVRWDRAASFVRKRLRRRTRGG
jgi:hypothetical protein